MAFSQTDRDLNLLGIIDLWHSVAVDQIDDIGGWRDCTATALAELEMNDHVYTRVVEGLGWDEPERFLGNTIMLVSRITSDFPKLDPTSLQDICAAVATWHKERNAKNIPSQTLLEVALDRAAITLQAVSSTILGRLDSPNTADLADQKKLFPNGVPNDPDLVDAIVRLQTERNSDNTDIEILRNFTSETKDDFPKAKKLQDRIRKARRAVRTTLPRRK